MAFSFTHKETTADTGAEPYSTGTISFVAGRVYFLGVTAAESGGITAPTLSGTTETWTLVDESAAYDSSRRTLFVFQLKCLTTESVAVAIDWPADAPVSCFWSLIEVDGIDTTTPVVQSDPATGAAVTSLAISLAAGPTAGNASLVFVAKADVSEGIANDAAFTELGEAIGTGTGGDSGAIESEYKTAATQTCTPTWGSNSDCGGVHLELKASVGTSSSFATLTQVATLKEETFATLIQSGLVKEDAFATLIQSGALKEETFAVLDQAATIVARAQSSFAALSQAATLIESAFATLAQSGAFVSASFATLSQVATLKEETFDVLDQSAAFAESAFVTLGQNATLKEETFVTLEHRSTLEEIAIDTLALEATIHEETFVALDMAGTFKQDTFAALTDSAILEEIATRTLQMNAAFIEPAFSTLEQSGILVSAALVGPAKRSFWGYSGFPRWKFLSVRRRTKKDIVE